MKVIVRTNTPCQYPGILVHIESIPVNSQPAGRRCVLTWGWMCRARWSCGLRLHENEPMRHTLCTRHLAENGLVRRQCQHFARLDLGFVPLEHQHTLGFEYTEAFSEPGAQVLAPVGAQLSVLGSQPAFWAGALQVRRVKSATIRNEASGNGIARSPSARQARCAACACRRRGANGR